MTWTSADFVVADGPRRYSDLEGTGVYNMEIGRYCFCQWAKGIFEIGSDSDGLVVIRFVLFRKSFSFWSRYMLAVIG